MQCIFCRQDSSSSRSVEHIVPYSLGNRRHILPRGVVCDTCNNYFSREVERPFLEAPAVKLLRFHQELESRKGRIPAIGGVILPDIPTVVMRDFKSGELSAEVPLGAYEQLAAMEKGMLLLPTAGAAPGNWVISRFLAKVSLEAMALKLCEYPEGLSYLCDEKQLDPIRDHARRGRGKAWPFYTRRIYAPDAQSRDSDSEHGQILHEFDFLVTDAGEWYFVLAIFGLELTINVGGPDIEGYMQWLARNGGASPLYSGKNSGCPMPASPPAPSWTDSSSRNSTSPPELS